ncbi:MAG TPA: PhnD/SsuA/transferrin family substrate-binding protein [Acidiferrobacter sp.]|nr:PhnD/SsuA/transferrin family substrate-binding protein [Acidiferrobacter sp.]
MMRAQNGVRRRGWALILVGLLTAGVSWAQPLVLAVQPILSERATAKAFTPLATYIGQVLGRPCVVATSPNFLAYWQTMRKAHGDAFILDAAHFTDYRITHLGYHLLVKEPGTVSYSLVARSSEMIFGPADLVGHRIASLGIPSMGAALLNRMFPDPSRRPIIVGAADASAELQLLMAKKVAAAMVPTPIVGQAMARGTAIMVITTTDPIPNIAVSAAPWISAKERAQVRAALLHAPPTLLHAIGLPAFVAARAQEYSGQSRVLQEYWGY